MNNIKRTSLLWMVETGLYTIEIHDRLGSVQINTTDVLPLMAELIEQLIESQRDTLHHGTTNNEGNQQQ